MLTLPPSVRIYLTTGAVDLRRGHDGLAALVLRQWGEALYQGHLFVFLGRRLDRCKVLFFDRGGLVLYYKRLEKGRFRMPSVSGDGAALELDATGLAMLLDGIDVRHVRIPARSGHPFRRDPATRSDGTRPAIPGPGHWFRWHPASGSGTRPLVAR